MIRSLGRMCMNTWDRQDVLMKHFIGKLTRFTQGAIL